MKKQEQYKLGTDGCLVRVDTPLAEGWDKCTSLESLLAHAGSPLEPGIEQRVRWTGSRLPARLLQNVLGTVRRFPSMEVGFTLQYRVSDATWRVACPEQQGSGGAVHFKDQETTDGYAVIGTIHTHPDMPAFWSGTDLHDQEGKFGLHIVLGLVDGAVSQSLCTLFTPGGKYDHALADVCEPVDLAQPYEPVQEWVDTIRRQSYKRAATPPVPCSTAAETPLPGYTVLGRNAWDNWLARTWSNPCPEHEQQEDSFLMDEERWVACSYNLQELIQDVGLDTVLQTLRDMFPELLIIGQEELQESPAIVDAVNDCMEFLSEAAALAGVDKSKLSQAFAAHGLLDVNALPGKEESSSSPAERMRYELCKDFVTRWIAVNGIPAEEKKPDA